MPQRIPQIRSWTPGVSRERAACSRPQNLRRTRIMRVPDKEKPNKQNPSQGAQLRIRAFFTYLDLKPMSSNSPKTLNATQMASILHALGLQVHDFPSPPPSELRHAGARSSLIHLNVVGNNLTGERAIHMGVSTNHGAPNIDPK